MTLPKEWDEPHAFSTSTGKELYTCVLKKVRVNVKRSIYLFVQGGRVEFDFIVDRLTKSDNRKSSILYMPKTVCKWMGGSLSVNSMDRLKQFCVINNCSSEILSVIKMVSVYHCRETVV